VRSKVPPLIHRYVLRPFEDTEDIERGRDFFSTGNVEVEIGFARGHFLRERLAQEPTHRFLGFEIRRRWCERMARFLDREERTNTRIILSDARPLLNELLTENTVAALHVYFPDPWWKKRHHKRRIMSPETLTLMHRLLAPDGSIHFRTDVLDYFEMVEALFAESTGFRKAQANHTLNGVRLPLTHREKKCGEVGVPIYSLHFVKTATSE
jgi:tRNA (guanine-N7-)-methyltransferase